MNKVYAIGLKKYVEVRAAKVPPVKQVSTTYRQSKTKVFQGYDYSENVARVVYRDVTKKTKFQCIVYEGGKLLGSIPSRKFSNATKVAIRYGGMVELSTGMITALQEKGLLK